LAALSSLNVQNDLSAKKLLKNNKDKKKIKKNKNNYSELELD